MSVLLPAPDTGVGWMPLITGLAVARAVSETAGVHAGVKWPNDVLVEEDEWRKVCGVLCEVHPAGVVVGFGVNVDQTREELPIETATSLRLCGAEQVRREDLIGSCLAHLHALHADLLAGGERRETLHAAYRSACRTSGWSSTSRPASRPSGCRRSASTTRAGSSCTARAASMPWRPVTWSTSGRWSPVAQVPLPGCSSRCCGVLEVPLGAVRTIPGKHGMISGVGGRPHARRRSARGGVGGAQDRSAPAGAPTRGLGGRHRPGQHRGAAARAARHHGRREVSRGARVSLLSARKFWHALGFPIVEDEDAAFTEADLVALKAVARLVREEQFDERTALAMTRAFARTTDRLAVWQTQLMAEALASPELGPPWTRRTRAPSPTSTPPAPLP